MKKRYHVCMSLHNAFDEIKKHPECYRINGKPVREKDLPDIKRFLDYLKKQGYTAVPPCNNTNEQGICQGHDEDEFEESTGAQMFYTHQSTLGDWK